MENIDITDSLHNTHVMDKTNLDLSTCVFDKVGRNISRLFGTIGARVMGHTIIKGHDDKHEIWVVKHPSYFTKQGYLFILLLFLWVSQLCATIHVL